jgi:hypothetical protein
MVNFGTGTTRAAPFPNELYLPYDFVFQVPWEDDGMVRLGFADPGGMINRDPGRNRPCLYGLGSTVYSIIIPTDAAAVQQYC